MAEEFVIAFEAGISSIDQDSLNEAAKQIRRTLAENTDFNINLNQQSLTATVEKLKIIGQEGDNVRKILATVKVGDDVYNLKYVKKAEGDWEELPRTVSVSVKKIEDELKTLYNRATNLQKQLNNALKTNAEGFASFYQEALNGINDEITATEQRLAKAVANSGTLPIGTKDKAATSYAQQKSFDLGTGYLAAMSEEDISRQAGAVSRLATAYRDLLAAQKQVITLQNTDGANESVIRAYQNQVDLAQNRIRLIEGENSAYLSLSQAKKKEVENELSMYSIQAKAIALATRAQQALKDEQFLLKKKIDLENRLYQLEKKMSTGATGALYRTKENESLVSSYKQEISVLNSKIQSAKEFASSLGKEAEATKIYNDAIKEQNDILKENNALNSKNKSLTANIRAGLEGVIQRVASYTIVYQTLYKIAEAGREAIDIVISLDKAFTDIRMVTQGSVDETYELANSYAQLAKELGSTVDQVAASATEFLRQGRTVEQTTDLIRASLVLSKVGAIESAEATTYLTSTINGFQMSAQEAMHIVDALSAVDLNAATSVEELAKALQRSANSGREAGIEFERLVGYIGAVSEATRRAPETIGESLKTIIARFQNVKVGKSLDSFNQPLNDVESSLNSIGIQLRTSETEWRSVQSVLDDVNKRWETLNQTQKNQIATAVAGQRQRENFLALMANYDRALELEAVALNSNGLAMEKFQIYLQSIESSLNELKAAFQDLVFNETTVMIIKAATEALTLLLTVLKDFLPLVTTLAAINLADILFDKFIPRTSEAIESLGIFQKLLFSVAGGGDLISGLSSITSGFASMLTVVGSLAIALTSVWSISKKIAIEQNKTREAIKTTVRQYQSDIDALNDLKKEQKEIEENIIKMESLDKSIVNPDDLEALKAENEQLKEQIALKEKAKQSNFQDNYSDAFNTLNSGMDRSNSLVAMPNLKETLEVQMAAYNDANQKIKEYTSAYNTLKNREADLNEKELENLYRYSNLIELYTKKREEYAAGIKESSELVSASLEILKANNDDSGLIEAYDPVAEAAKKLLNSIVELNPPLAESVGIIEELGDESFDASDNVESLSEQLSSLADAQKLISTVQDDISSTGSITASTLSSISARYPELLTYVDRYIAGLMSEAELLDRLKIAYEADEKEKLQSVVNKLAADTEYYNRVLELNSDMVKRFKEFYNVDLSNAKTLAEAKLEVDKLLINTLSGAWSEYYTALNKAERTSTKSIIGKASSAPGLAGDAARAMMASLEQLDNYIEATDELNAISLKPLQLQFDKLTTATNASTSSVNEYNKAIKAAQSASNKLLEYTISMLKKEAEARRDALKEELDNYKKIIDARKEALDLQKEQYNYSKDIASRNSEIAELEAKIAALQFDTSAEGVAKRLELERELSEKRSDLEDKQYEHSIDQQKDALDKEYDDFKEQQEAKIKVIDKYLKESGRIAQEAMELIDSKADGLFQRLMDWNLKYGDGIRDTVVKAWEEAYAAMEKYGLSVSEFKNLDIETGSSSSSSSSSSSNSSSNGSSNSSSSSGSGSNTKPNPDTGRGDMGVGQKVILNGRVYGNSYGEAPGRSFTNYKGKITKVNWGGSKPFHIDSLGWVSGGDIMPTYHRGINAGFVGGSGGNEVFAKLMKGEAVITPQQQTAFIDKILPETIREYTKTQDSGMNIDTFLNVDVQGNLDQSVIPHLQDIVNKSIKEINNVMFKRGFTRKTNRVSI